MNGISRLAEPVKKALWTARPPSRFFVSSLDSGHPQSAGEGG
jgi:hypothetical protein